MNAVVRITLVVCCIGVAGTLAFPSSVEAAGFEVGENTPEATARGGTGAVNNNSASALYFNPARLGRVDGSQVLLSSNFLQLNAEFQRDTLVVEDREPQSFDLARNRAGVRAAPFITASFDVGPEELSVGAGLFGPPAYGMPCWGQIEDGECQPERLDAARGMAVSSDIIVAYAAGGIGYSVDLGEERQLELGWTLAAAYQRSDFSVVVEADPTVGSPWDENPDREAFVQGRNLTDLTSMNIIGIAFQDGPLRLAASYRPPIHWDTTGSVEVDYPEFLQDQNPHLSDNTMHLETWHAGSLRLGWGLEWGEHPGDARKPRANLEFNTVWENWSVVDNFRIEIAGDINGRFGDDEDAESFTVAELQPIYQRKSYQDTISLRSGFSWGFLPWLTGHVGAFMETAAQPVAYTSADFMSWERYSGSLGASFHLPRNLEFDLGYSYIHSPERVVENGEVYNPIPMSQCRGPDYQASACDEAGTPPGNPQNEGTWRANFQTLSAGMRWNY